MVLVGEWCIYQANCNWWKELKIEARLDCGPRPYLGSACHDRLVVLWKQRNEPNSAAPRWATGFKEAEPMHTKSKCCRKATLLTVLAAAAQIPATFPAFPDAGDDNVEKHSHHGATETRRKTKAKPEPTEMAENTEAQGPRAPPRKSVLIPTWEVVGKAEVV
jgi:hypothetical protein